MAHTNRINTLNCIGRFAMRILHIFHFHFDMLLVCVATQSMHGWIEYLSSVIKVVSFGVWNIYRTNSNGTKSLHDWLMRRFVENVHVCRYHVIEHLLERCCHQTRNQISAESIEQNIKYNVSRLKYLTYVEKLHLAVLTGILIEMMF